jgi:hypothetical protein
MSPPHHLIFSWFLTQQLFLLLDTSARGIQWDEHLSQMADTDGHLKD